MLRRQRRNESSWEAIPAKFNEFRHRGRSQTLLWTVWIFPLGPFVCRGGSCVLELTLRGTCVVRFWFPCHSLPDCPLLFCLCLFSPHLLGVGSRMLVSPRGGCSILVVPECCMLALDLLFLGRYPALEELSRRPTAAQSEIIAWLRSQLAVCRLVEETFPLAPGRAGPELSAALLQLEVCCWLSGVSTRLP